MQRTRFASRVAIAVVAIAISSWFAAIPTAQAPPPAPAPAAQGQRLGANLEHPVLPIGSAFPDFALPGIDDKVHKASEYAKGNAIAVVFESNHCPVSQLYEARVEALYREYKPKGVTFVAINPNNAKAVRLNELGYTDVTDSLPEMKLRARLRGIDWPYLYDGETQAVSQQYGAVATPHIFIFGPDHKLAYQGRIDDNQREELVKTKDARNALDAILAGKPVPVETTRAFGCTTKWISKTTDVEQEWAKILAEPVTLDAIGIDELKTLRSNPTAKVTLVSLWSAACALCTSQLADLETTFRMFRLRAFNLVTINVDSPAGHAKALEILQKEHASSPNKRADADRTAIQAAWGVKWSPAQPLTMVLAPGGEVLYQKEGKFDIYEVRRAVLAAMPDTSGYIGSKAYWMNAVAEAKARQKR
jgi:peroxiredoxin